MSVLVMLGMGALPVNAQTGDTGMHGIAMHAPTTVGAALSDSTVTWLILTLAGIALLILVIVIARSAYSRNDVSRIKVGEVASHSDAPNFLGE